VNDDSRTIRGELRGRQRPQRVDLGRRQGPRPRQQGSGCQTALPPILGRQPFAVTLSSDGPRRADDQAEQHTASDSGHLVVSMCNRVRPRGSSSFVKSRDGGLHSNPADLLRSNRLTRAHRDTRAVRRRQQPDPTNADAIAGRRDSAGRMAMSKHRSASRIFRSRATRPIATGCPTGIGHAMAASTMPRLIQGHVGKTPW
jgi:hypothetical protein